MKIKLFNTIDEVTENSNINNNLIIEKNVDLLKENIQQLNQNNLLHTNLQIQNQEVFGQEKKVIVENNIISENDMRNELSKLINSELDTQINSNNNSTLISELPL